MLGRILEIWLLQSLDPDLPFFKFGSGSNLSKFGSGSKLFQTPYPYLIKDPDPQPRLQYFSDTLTTVVNHGLEKPERYTSSLTLILLLSSLYLCFLHSISQSLMGAFYCFCFLSYFLYSLYTFVCLCVFIHSLALHSTV